MPAFEWVHVQLHQQKGMISLSPPTICNSAQTCAILVLMRLDFLSPAWEGALLRMKIDRQIGPLRVFIEQLERLLSH
ncbi:hypothetical protein, partial [Klebsiella pneumoniae]